MNESTYNILLSGVMGLIGGIITIPIGAFINWRMKKEELELQNKLSMIAKQHELFLQYKFEIQKMTVKNSEIGELKTIVFHIKQKLGI